MRTTTDEEMIARGGRVGQVGNFIGLVMVFAGLLMSFTPWKILTIILIGLGVVMYTVGNRGLERAARVPRFIEQLADALAGFDDRYHLYNHVLPAEHVLLTPYGIFVLVVRGVGGSIRCYKDKWVRDFSLRRLLRFFTEESLGNPTKDAQRQVKKVQEYLDEHIPEADVPVQGLAVFLRGDVRLEVTSPSVPVLPLRNLKSHIRKGTRQEDMAPETLTALTELFDGAVIG